MRLSGVANAAPYGYATYGGYSLPQTELLQAFIFFLLILDVLADHSFVSPHRRHKVPSCPKVLPDKFPLPLSLHPRQVNRALALHKTDHVRYRVLRWYLDKHVDVIRHQVPFQDFTFPLLR